VAHRCATNREPPSRFEERQLGEAVAATSYLYDTRGRLYEEIRTDNLGVSDYYLQYHYDQGGNRTKKVLVDFVAGTTIETRYEYDIDDVPLYGTATNRLMKYAVYDSPGPGETLVSTTYYYYSDSGNPWRIVTETEDPEPGQPRFSVTFRKYTAKRGGE